MSIHSLLCPLSAPSDFGIERGRSRPYPVLWFSKLSLASRDQRRHSPSRALVRPLCRTGVPPTKGLFNQITFQLFWLYSTLTDLKINSATGLGLALQATSVTKTWGEEMWVFHLPQGLICTLAPQNYSSVPIGFPGLCTSSKMNSQWLWQGFRERLREIPNSSPST